MPGVRGENGSLTSLRHGLDSTSPWPENVGLITMRASRSDLRSRAAASRVLKLSSLTANSMHIHDKKK